MLQAAANPSTGEEEDSWGSFGGDEDTDGDSWGEDFRRKRAAGRYKREAQEVAARLGRDVKLFVTGDISSLY